MVRAVAVMVGLLAAAPAVAGEMNADEARHFVVGKLFNYSCFEGTRGQGRVNPDGSVVGSIQLQGSGRVRFAALPAGTLRVKGESVCASLRGLPMQPCFTLTKLGDDSFRGAISGLGFAYCDFTKHAPARAHVAHKVREEAPVALRPSLAAENN
jgi:hypothetical protein